MRTSFIATLIALSSLTAQAQSPANELIWMKHITGRALSSPMIETDMAGHVLVAARYFNIGNTLTAYEGDTLYTQVNLEEDVVLMKFDGDGVLLWNVIIQGTAPISIVGFDVDLSDNVVLCLRSFEEISLQGQQFQAGHTVLKLDPDANLLWHTAILGAAIPSFKSDMISVDPYNRVVIAGTIGTVNGDSLIGFDPWTLAPDTVFYYNQVSDTLMVNGAYYAPPGERNLFFCRLDSNGNVDQQHQFAYTTIDPISVSSMDASSGDILIAGNTYGTDLILDGDTLDTDAGHLGSMCVLRFTDQGLLLWGRTYYGSPAHSISGADVLMSPGSNNAFVSCYFYETADYNGDTILSAGVQDALLLKVDGTGTMLWAKPVGDIHTNQNSWLAASTTGSVVISGYGINHHELMRKYNSNGTTEWILPYSGDGNMDATNAEFNNLGELFCAGTFDDEMVIGGASMNTQPSGGREVFILKFRNQDIINGVTETAPLDPARPWPNPGRDYFNIRIPGSCDLQVFDSTGRLLLELRTTGEIITVDASSFAPGLFTFRLRDLQGLPLAMGRWVKE